MADTVAKAQRPQQTALVLLDVGLVHSRHLALFGHVQLSAGRVARDLQAVRIGPDEARLLQALLRRARGEDT